VLTEIIKSRLAERSLRIVKNKKNYGFTLIELLVVAVIISILASIAIPVVEVSVKREKELQFRRALRTIREAIDEYQKFAVEKKIEMDEDTYHLPKSLKDLLEGIEYTDKKSNKKLVRKFLRRIPIDPITNTVEWGLRSYQDKPDVRKWGGENVWDVYTTSERKALDETYYKDW